LFISPPPPYLLLKFPGSGRTLSNQTQSESSWGSSILPVANPINPFPQVGGSWTLLINIFYSVFIFLNKYITHVFNYYFFLTNKAWFSPPAYSWWIFPWFIPRRIISEKIGRLRVSLTLFVLLIILISELLIVNIRRSASKSTGDNNPASTSTKPEPKSEPNSDDPNLNV
jgi:hypothetical protein